MLVPLVNFLPYAIIGARIAYSMVRDRPGKLKKPWNLRLGCQAFCMRKPGDGKRERFVSYAYEYVMKQPVLFSRMSSKTKQRVFYV